MTQIKYPWFNHYDPQVPQHLTYPGVTLDWFLDSAAEKYADRASCVFMGASLSYGDLRRLVENLAGQLIRQGMKIGDRVAVILPNCPQFILAFYAIAKAGGVVVAINPAYKEAELSFQLVDSGARFVIALESHVNLIQSIRAGIFLEKVYYTSLMDGMNLNQDRQNNTDSVLPQDDDWLLETLRQPVLAPQPNRAQPAMPVIFQYSGGTTGTPKAAIGTHHNLVANTQQFKSWLGGLEDGKEVVLAAIPLFHVYGMVIAMSLGVASGATLVLIPDPRDLDGILSSIEQYKATLFPGVPAMYQSIIQKHEVLSGQYRLHSIKACISGAAPLLPEVKQKFEAVTGGKLLEGYGLSEAPTATHCNPLNGENRTGSIGLPLPDVEAVIVNIEDGVTILPPGETGELVLRGPQVMQAYHNNPGETELALREGWLHTGDIARMDADGYFYLVGRKKEMVKVGGFQVWPREIEEVIATHPAVLECAVAGVVGSDLVETVKAWVVVRVGMQVSPEEIRAWCDQRMARFKVPAEVEFIERLPRTTVGKVLKRELVRLTLERRKKAA